MLNKEDSRAPPPLFVSARLMVVVVKSNTTSSPLRFRVYGIRSDRVNLGRRSAYCSDYTHRSEFVYKAVVFATTRVLELAKESSTSIPSKYLRSDIEKAVVPNGDHIPEIPVIDMQKLVSVGPNNPEVEKLDFACKEWGFFQLVNHGVDSALLENLKAEIDAFFKLPMEEKKKWWQSPGNAEGFGQAFVVSDDQKLDWGDLFFMVTYPLRLRNPRLIPSLPSPLSELMECYTSELNNLSTGMLEKIAEALHMKPEEMTEFVGEGRQTIRINCYPPCELSDQVMELTPHSDATLITILLQLNDVDGLEIRKDGKWYRSIEHCGTVHPVKERLSFAMFFGLGLDGELGPAPSLISEQTPAKFKRVKVQEFYKGLFSRRLQGKAYVDTYKIQLD
ncbi:Protein SRG1 [Hibiscus syriacus]|uniref:Protein SRG1 n=1 Tax=Hibiscus syriacus TaxID=106335 RepID=A0A6A2YLK1_HIBSY|nr:Protein SRG1 [Hibiscus syriacus]